MQTARLKSLIDQCTTDLRESNQDAEQREMLRLCAINEGREQALRAPIHNRTDRR